MPCRADAASAADADRTPIIDTRAAARYAILRLISPCQRCRCQALPDVLQRRR